MNVDAAKQAWKKRLAGYVATQGGDIVDAIRAEEASRKALLSEILCECGFRLWDVHEGKVSMQAEPVGAPKSYPYSRLLDEQRIEELSSALATMSNQLADANRALHLWQQVALAHGLQMPSDPPASDPGASPNRSIVDQTIDALDKRLVGRTDRTRLRGALDKADAPLTGKDAANEAIGRIARLGVVVRS